MKMHFIAPIECANLWICTNNKHKNAKQTTTALPKVPKSILMRLDGSYALKACLITCSYTLEQ